MTIIGLWTGLYAYANYYDPDKIKVCKGATDYALTPAYRETEIELQPDCWSGNVRSYGYAMFWGTKDGRTPYEALFGNEHIYKGNGPDIVINEVVRHPGPIRFRGTGKLRITLFDFEGSVSNGR